MNNSAPIRVFLVEDSPVALTILKRILTSSSEVDVVGTALNGVEALERIRAAQPQVICTDLHMPKMDGLELTHQIMANYPRPILVIIGLSTPKKIPAIFLTCCKLVRWMFSPNPASTPFQTMNRSSRN